MTMGADLGLPFGGGYALRIAHCIIFKRGQRIVRRVSIIDDDEKTHFHSVVVERQGENRL